MVRKDFPVGAAPKKLATGVPVASPRTMTWSFATQDVGNFPARSERRTHAAERFGQLVARQKS